MSTFLNETQAREIAAKWCLKPGSHLDHFARTAEAREGVLDEVREVYTKPISPDQRASVLQLGRYLAAMIWEHDARADDTLRRSQRL